MFEVHRALLSDTVRLDAYREALCRVVAPGDVVVDLGSGIGILALLACEAGARRVFAIEADGIVAAAAGLAVKRAGYADRIAIVRGLSTEVTLSERADVLVTDTLGPFGLDAGILVCAIDARRRLLRPGGAMVPRQLTLSLVPVDAHELYETTVGWWSAPRGGFDFSAVTTFASNTPHFTRVDAGELLAAPATLLDLDLQSLATPAVSGAGTFTCARDGVLHGFAGWFTATLAPGIAISNGGPRRIDRRHVFLPLEAPVSVHAGTTVSVMLDVDERNGWRWHGTVASVPAAAFDQSTWFGAATDRPSTPG